jgi:hypothetical protein
VAAAVGMRVRIKAYPEGPPIRDVPQVALMREFQARLGAGARPMVVEQPAATRAGDLRAFDAYMDIGGGIGFEFVTRFHDCQAQLRAIRLKQRDAGVARVIVVVKATHANRAAIRAVADVVDATFAVSTRRALAARARGEDPGGDALIFI